MTHKPNLPIKLDSATNGEYAPMPVGREVAHAAALAAERIAGNAKRLGQSRRRFMAGICGAATSLLAMNDAFALRGAAGGRFAIPPEGALEPEAAQAIVGREFIFDIQTHFIEANGIAWRRGMDPVQASAGLENLRARLGIPRKECRGGPGLKCYDAENFIKDVFLDSDTDLAVLSFVPAMPEQNPVSMREAARVRDLVAALGQNRRLLLHAMMVPNVDDRQRELQRMAEIHAQYNISAWKVYPQWGPKGVGWWLDDPEIGVPFLEQARHLGVKNICMHKGLSFAGNRLEYGSCIDVARAAKKFPDLNFIVYHSGIEANKREGAYDAATADRGIDSLVKSMIDNGVAPNSNVYAELGSTWRIVMRDPDQAAHAIGKLVKHIGAKRVLWGTDSVWYGSPQDQIQAFRAFQISQESQGKFGYPALTPELKADIFGLNAAPIYGVDPAKARRRASADPLGKLKAEYREVPAPSFATYGPRDAGEWRRFRAVHGVGPG